MPSRYPLPSLRFATGILIMTILLLVFFFAKEGFEQALYDAIFRIQRLIDSQPLLGALSFLFLSALSAILAFTSSVLLIPSAILVWGMPLTFFLLLGGWIVGAVFTYWVGVWVARSVLTFFVTEERFSRYERLISKETKFWMVLLFCLAVPSEIPGFLLGSIRYDFTRFISAVIITETIYALSSIFVAQNILDKEILSIVGAVLFLVVLIAAASFALIRIKRGADPKH